VTGFVSCFRERYASVRTIPRGVRRIPDTHSPRGENATSRVTGCVSPLWHASGARRVTQPQRRGVSLVSCTSRHSCYHLRTVVLCEPYAPCSLAAGVFRS